MRDPVEWLRASGAQGDVIDGLTRYAKDWPTLWNACPRGDWLLSIALKLGVDHALAVHAAIGCARVASDLASADPAIAQAFAQVLDAAERWTRAEETKEIVADKTRALEAASARASDPSIEAAARAGIAVGMGITDREVLTAAPAAAAEAQMMASMDCGFEMAMRWAHDKCASAVRAAIPWSAIETCLAAAT